MHAASKGCWSACRQQRVGLDLRDGELQVVDECLRLCAQRVGSRGIAAVLGRRQGPTTGATCYVVILSRARCQELSRDVLICKDVEDYCVGVAPLEQNY